jgi:hypothetical protein
MCLSSVASDYDSGSGTEGLVIGLTVGFHGMDSRPPGLSASFLELIDHGTLNHCVVVDTTMGSCHSSSPVPTDTEASVSLLSEQTLMNSQLSVAPSSHLKDPTCAPSTSDTPTSSDGSLTLRNVDIWEEDASKDPRAQLSRTVLQHTDFEEVLRSHQVMTEDRHIFNHQLKLLPRPVTNQKSSGRCWLFATTNVVRYGMMKKLRVVDFELSQVSDWYRIFTHNMQIRYNG